MDATKMTVDAIERLLIVGAHLVTKIWIDDFTRDYVFSHNGHMFMVEAYEISGGQFLKIQGDTLADVLVALCFKHATLQASVARVKRSPEVETEQMKIVKVVKVENEQKYTQLH